MRFYLYLTILFFVAFFYGCEKTIFVEGIEGTIVCEFSNISVTELDNIVIADANEPVLWQGTYSDTTVRINFTEKLDNHGASETMNFVFNKVDDCLQIDYGYEFYNGGIGDISAITKVDVLEFYVTEWVLNEKLAGQIVYRDHHDKLVKSLNFWYEFSISDYKIENTTFNYFSDCFLSKLPIEIDLDNDGEIDYNLTYEEELDFANRPNFTFYTIKLISTDETINQILSPRGVSIPFPVIFEPPFSTENTRSYAANKFKSVDVRNSLDVFYEFDTPFENYNFYLQNNLTYKKEFENNKDDYYAVKLIRDDENFYGWIKIDFNALDCKIEVLDTFLNSTPNKHVYVD